MKNRKQRSGYFECGIPYIQFGKGSLPLVLFQGLLFKNKPQSGMTFGYDFLGERFTVFSLLRKPGLPSGYTLKDMARDYAELIRTEFDCPVDILGVSTGGSIAQHFAADYPHLVRSLVLHSSAHMLAEKARLAQLEVGHLAQQWRGRAAAEYLIAFMLPSEGIWRYIAVPMARLSAPLIAPGGSNDLSNLVVTVAAEDKHFFQDRLAEIRAPTLVIAGMEDPFYSPDLFCETAAGIPNARLMLFEKMRHPAVGRAFNREVLRFLTEGLPPT
jgi:pimeloyl-ACP methyl ester carboxylesterase